MYITDHIFKNSDGLKSFINLLLGLSGPN